jgi:hypothetical protein
MLTQEYVDKGDRDASYRWRVRSNFGFMCRRVSRDPETSPRDAVKVTGWAIRRTILRNSPERHLRRSLITCEGEEESSRKDDEIAEWKTHSYNMRIKFVFRERIIRRQQYVPFQFSSFLYTIRIVFSRHKHLRHTFLILTSSTFLICEVKIFRVIFSFSGNES